MEKNVKECLDELRRKKQELKSASKDMTKKGKLYEEAKTRYNEAITRKELLEDEIDNFSTSQIFQVRLGDLLEELSHLTNIPIEEIEVDLFFDAWYKADINMNVEDMKAHLNVIRPGIVFNICSSNGHFEYFGTSKGYEKSELPIIQADGKSLFAHSSFKYANSIYFGKNFVAPVIDKDIEDIILKFNLGYLEKTDSAIWYPSELFIEAIINCLEKENQKQQQKVKTKKKAFPAVIVLEQK